MCGHWLVKLVCVDVRNVISHSVVECCSGLSNILQVASVACDDINNITARTFVLCLIRGAGDVFCC